MKKTEFIAKIADKTGSTRKEADAFLKAFEEIMLEDIFAAEDSIRLEIGTFSGVTKAARKARNPKTGETITVEAKSGFPKYKPSKVAKA